MDFVIVIMMHRLVIVFFNPGPLSCTCDINSPVCFPKCIFELSSFTRLLVIYTDSYIARCGMFSILLFMPIVVLLEIILACY